MNQTALPPSQAFRSLCYRYGRQCVDTVVSNPAKYKHCKVEYSKQDTTRMKRESSFYAKKYNRETQPWSRPNINPHNEYEGDDDMPVYGAIFRSNTGRYALVRGRKSGKWSFPKGHAMRGESPLDCVIREVGEEIGVDIRDKPHTVVKLFVSYYYFFTVDDEFTLNTFDRNEICETCWATIDEMKQMKLNVDVSTFVRGQY
jgi:ADP-ribose pyrophosphatase YjhB (NUDIX family)